MNHLILIKHARPQIDETQSAPDWHLSDSGRASCTPLAEALRPYKPDLLITSEEPKARETGQLVADALQIPYSSAPNFHEHDRKGVLFIPQETWHTTVKTFFAHPNDLIFGNETANQARLRFTRAVEKTVQTHPHKTIAHRHTRHCHLFIHRPKNPNKWLRPLATIRPAILCGIRPTGLQLERHCNTNILRVNF